MSHGLAGGAVADAGAFLVRLVRLDPAGLVRIRAAGADRVALWGRLPWGALVTRTLSGPGGPGSDVTVGARELLAELTAGGYRLPRRRDADWRWPLPATSAETLEEVPADRIRELGSAAERTVRAALASGGPVGERMIRDAVLDHVAIVVEAAGTGPGPAGAGVAPATVTNATAPPKRGRNVRVEVPQRLVQAVVRMSFLRRVSSDEEPTVRVVRAGGFIGLAAEYGVAWYRSGRHLPVHALIRSDEPS